MSELLGHSAVGITLDTYSHVTETMQRDAVDRLEGLIGGQNGGQGPQERPEEAESA